MQIADGYWHFIAVTWSSFDGATFLYVDGMLMWSAIMAKGMAVGDGGSLIFGQDQRIQNGWCCATLPNRSPNVNLNTLQKADTHSAPSFLPTACFAIRPFIFFPPLIFVCARSPEHLRGSWPTLRSGTSRWAWMTCVPRSIMSRAGILQVISTIACYCLNFLIATGLHGSISPHATPECRRCPSGNESYKVIASDGRPADEAQVQGAITSYQRAWR